MDHGRGSDQKKYMIVIYIGLLFVKKENKKKECVKGSVLVQKKKCTKTKCVFHPSEYRSAKYIIFSIKKKYIIYISFFFAFTFMSAVLPPIFDL